ncbi:MAG: phospholipase D-like domain-containing protein, partial [Stenotrophomonas sp.]
FSARSDVNFQDLDLVVAGPAVQQANQIFDDYWNSDAAVPIGALATYTDAQLRQLVRQSDRDALQTKAQPYLQRVADSRQRQRPSPEPLHWSAQVRIVSDPPMKHRDDARDTWLVTELVRQLQSTRSKALLISPYFVPGAEGLEGLSAMAGRGAQVGVVTNSLAANDVAAVHGGYMGYRVPLLKAGVQLYELKAHGQPGDSSLFGSSGASLHTKALLVDDRRGFVGSFNLDPRSAYLNTEMGVLFDDAVLGVQLRAEYLRLASPAHSWWLALGADD